MDATARSQVIDRLKEELAQRADATNIAIIGKTPAALDLLHAVVALDQSHRLLGVYAAEGTATADAPRSDARPLAQLRTDRPDLVIVASDHEKEALIEAALPFVTSSTKFIIGGFGHFQFRDPIFARETANAFAPSFANGYPNTLIHIFQCLQSAARAGLQGAVAEFGMFKGGTTMLISRFIEAFGMDWKVYGFDTFEGFPPPRSALDMYAHPDCVYMDLDTVRRYFVGRNVEVIPGDVVETVHALANSPIVLAFIDTDNFTAAAAIVDVVADLVVPGGAIVFDHFTGRDRFLYTLGERMAGARLLHDRRYLNLHDTGVFLRLT
ncbi:MAG: TylF/MycF family methyltransferase [Alphaproteobacteria bacterium]|nr:TylF/MycF family methyltransferase [Alphaproteobacteria bacterium]MBU0794055.1 TylF/MycF family methyltransferase [Alphaproteobacteria bacterium]MBU0877376.1 TylF/MycF family methyltransferase [Alphaproteobacteria bacterium]MBU1770243.1 TylF/MycF family methyltransferase [Alphaproteobacteria bacterium]